MHMGLLAWIERGKIRRWANHEMGKVRAQAPPTRQGRRFAERKIAKIRARMKREMDRTYAW